MHPDELDVPAELVRRLLEEQLPELAHLPLRPMRWGTVNAMYRLGDELLVRLPRRAEWADAIALEREWLPFLSRRLPVPIPEPVGFGDPSDAFPLPWAVFRHLEGTPLLDAGPVDEVALAEDLAAVVNALRELDEPDRPFPPGRGRPLAERDAYVRERIPEVAPDADPRAVARVWEHALTAPPWGGRPLFAHGDLMPPNVLTAGRRLAGVVDWGSCGSGDPACESLLAWMTLSAAGRARYRALVPHDDATWARARGWALSCAVMALPYYRQTYPVLADVARRTFAEVLADDLE